MILFLCPLVFFVMFQLHRVTWVGLEDADSDCKLKETMTGNITKTGRESRGPFLNIIKCC